MNMSKYINRESYVFPMATVPNYHKLSLRQHQLIFLELWRWEVWHGPPWPELTSLGSLERILAWPLPAPRGCLPSLACSLLPPWRPAVARGGFLWFGPPSSFKDAGDFTGPTEKVQWPWLILRLADYISHNINSHLPHNTCIGSEK